jgi:cytochrome b561
VTPFGRLAECAARVSHVTLYALLLAVPALGIIAELKRAGILPVFGFWQLRSPWPIDRVTGRTLRDLHGNLADALLILAGIHVVAALIHHWIWRDRTLVRMLPGAS